MATTKATTKAATEAKQLQTVADYSKLTLAQLESIYLEVSQYIKVRRQIQAETMKLTLRPGMRVKSSLRRAAGQTFVLERIGPKNAVCRNEETTIKWRIPIATLLAI